jgi:hypothetical protein
MVQTLVAQVDKRMDVGMALSMQAAEPGIDAQDIVARALTYCADKMNLDGPSSVVERLRQGDGAACGYCLYSLAKQVAEAIGALDENVKVVYTFDYDATPEDECFGNAAHGAPSVHLIVWTSRKTAALRSLVAVLDRSLVQAYAGLLGTSRLASLLDVQVIDDADVERRSGYGALLGSIHHRPIQVWQR